MEGKECAKILWTMITNDSVSIRAAQTSDSAQWAELYRGYRDFYALSPDDSIVERVWTWINDGSNEVNAFVATSGDRLVGLAHYRRFSRPSTGSVGIYLDDLFTDSTARGAGIGRTFLAGRSRRTLSRSLDHRRGQYSGPTSL